MQCNTKCQDSATAITKLWTIWYLIAYLLISNTDDKISLFPIQRCLLLQSLVRKWRCVVRTRSTFSRSGMVSPPNLSRERGTTMFVADRSALWDARSNKLYYFLNFFKNFLELYNKYFAIHNYIWLVPYERSRRILQYSLYVCCAELFVGGVPMSAAAETECVDCSSGLTVVDVFSALQASYAFLSGTLPYVNLCRTKWLGIKVHKII